MKKNYLILAIVSLLFLIFPILSRIGQNLHSIDTPLLHDAQVSDREDIKIFRINTGTFETLEGFLFAGGSFLKVKKGVHNATLIQHPKGNLLIDTGLGKEIEEQFKGMPTLLKPLFGFKKSRTAFEQLAEKNIQITSILLTHLHWDHASGLKDFGQPEIFTTKEEWEFSQSEAAKPPAYFPSQYEGLLKYKFPDFSDGSYETYNQSFDFFKDGSVVIVKLKGHSPGSIGIFVNITKNKRYFFIGDLTWSNAGISHSAHKFIVSSLLVDQDREQLAQEIGRLVSLLKRKPEIQIIPAHDFEAFEILKPL